MKYMAATHHPTVNLRFVMREGKRILQQLHCPYDWDKHKEEWRDVPLDESPDQQDGGREKA